MVRIYCLPRNCEDVFKRIIFMPWNVLNLFGSVMWADLLKSTKSFENSISRLTIFWLQQGSLRNNKAGRMKLVVYYHVKPNTRIAYNISG